MTLSASPSSDRPSESHDNQTPPLPPPPPAASPTKSRPAFAGAPSGPEPPFPIRLTGPIIKGFGRGSKELGIPTANIPVSGLSVGGHEDVESGIYFGFAGVDIDETGRRIGGKENENEDEDVNRNRNPIASPSATTDPKPQTPILEAEPTPTISQPPPPRENGTIYPMVMSIGWNPFYKNTVRSVEVHLLSPRPFALDFYGATMNLLILGFIRPEYDYVSAESLVRDIQIDIEVTRRSLEREGWREYEGEGWLREGF